jgi:Uma2 family endonuclease
MAIAEAEIKSKVQPGMKITEDEFLRLPKDGFKEFHKYELVDGRLKEVPTLSSHDQISFRLIIRLGPFMIDRGGVSTGQAGFRMSDGNIRVPDISFTRKDRLPGGRVQSAFGRMAPDLCIEIISPSEERADMARKVDEYFDAGATLVWHIFPETQQVTVFTSPTETQMLGAEDTLTAEAILPGFSCRVSAIFIME